MEERERARRLLRCLDLPSEAPKLLTDSRFWTPDVCAVYLDRCDDQLFDDPGSGLPMARLAPTLIHLLRPSVRRDGLLVRALTVLASALRATGSLSEADGAYRTAYAIALRTTISPLERANLDRRYVVLCLYQGRIDEAETFAQRAIDVLTSAAPEGDGDDCLGAALVQRGLVRLQQDRPEDAADDFGLALEVLDSRRNVRSYQAAVHNLAYALAQVDDLRALHRVSRHLRLARDLSRARPDGLSDYKLLWIEAILLRRMGATAEAEDCFVRARDGLARLGAAGDMVRASIELALVYRADGRLDELATLVEETLVLCRAMGVSAEAIAILGTWRKAVEERVADAELFESVAERFAAQVRR